MNQLARLPPEVLTVLRRAWSAPGSRQAVFDADGTLWRGDVGEDLLRHLAAEKVLAGDTRGLYAEYERRVRLDPAAAYGFAVEVMAGLEELRLRALCRDFFQRRFAGRLFPWVRPVIERLQREGVEVWLCSASPRWIVEAGAEALGLPSERVVAVSSEVVDGRLTARVAQPISAGPGKVTWLTRRGVTPTLAVGNGALDLDMLVAAKHALVVAPRDAPDSSLALEARRRGWPVLSC